MSEAGASSGSPPSQRSSLAQLPAPAFASWRQYASANCARSKVPFVAPRLVRFVDFERTPNGFISADFNGDGGSDFVVITPNEGCVEDAPIYYGAAGGPPTNFIISTPAGYRTFQGFTSNDHPKIERRGDRDVLHLKFSRTFTGRCGSVESAVWGWDGKGIDVIERRNPNGKLVDREGCAVGTSAAPKQPAAPNTSGLPIRVGYYAVNDTNCAAALRSWTAGVVIDEGHLRDIDGDYPVRPVRSLGGGRYRLGEAFDTVRILSPDGFIADEGQEHERRFLWCAEKAPQ